MRSLACSTPCSVTSRWCSRSSATNGGDMEAMATVPTRGTRPRRVAAALLIVASLPLSAAAQTNVPTADEPDDVYVEQVPSSTEQGQTPLDEAFAPRDRAQWIRETRRKAFKDTKWDIQ